MEKGKKILSVAMLLALSACYHATILTGRPEGTQKIEQPWALSWIYGLVPPKTLETAQKCPNGVARVETQMSFLNGLVAAITFEIFTPMDIKVTCAAGGTSSGPSVNVKGNPTEALEQAIELSRRSHTPVDVRF